jgi:sterol desaturase/sphingolipid hydroxylase (fatty acid hydroxylase superfamily)
MYLQHLLCEHVYGHLAYFDPKKRPNPTHSELLSAWTEIMLPVHVFIALTLVSIGFLIDDEVYEAAKRQDIPGPARMLVLLAISRVTIDVIFYAVHRALHLPWIFERVHARHHKHFATALSTNFQFSRLDLILESFFPVFCAFQTVQWIFGEPMNRFEQSVVACHALWYEIGSHCGKPVPIVSVFPPLRPLLEAAGLEMEGGGNVLFHETHHALRNCNYGITPYIDRLTGSFRLLTKKDGKET